MDETTPIYAAAATTKKDVEASKRIRETTTLQISSGILPPTEYLKTGTNPSS